MTASLKKEYKLANILKYFSHGENEEGHIHIYQGRNENQKSLITTLIWSLFKVQKLGKYLRRKSSHKLVKKRQAEKN